MERVIKTAVISLIFNTAAGISHIILGAASGSLWLFTVGMYYSVLSIIRFTVLVKRKNRHFLKKFTGFMLIILSLPLLGTVILSAVTDRGHVFHEVVMIGIAVFAFTKITLASINLIKTRQSTSEKMITLRTVSLASAFVSIFSLQRSMLVTFDGMSAGEITIMNIATGTGVCITVFLLGLNLLLRL